MVGKNQVIYDGAVIGDYGTVLHCPQCKARIVMTSKPWGAMETRLVMRGECKCSTDWNFTYQLRNLKVED